MFYKCLLCNAVCGTQFFHPRYNQFGQLFIGSFSLFTFHITKMRFLTYNLLYLYRQNGYIRYICIANFNKYRNYAIFAIE